MPAARDMAPLLEPRRSGVVRYSDRPWPAYRYVPGRDPHPIRDPAGHSYASGVRLHRHPPWQVEAWEQLEAWRYGVDLFNHFYFWEAHEAWEGLWASAERGSGASLLLQGLIQIAAALLKVHVGAIVGARRLSEQGLQKLHAAVAIDPVLMGVDIADLHGALSCYFSPLAAGRLPELNAAVPVLRLRLGRGGCNA